MGYGSVHRFLLRSIASRGVMSVVESQGHIDKFSDDEQNTYNVKEVVKDINQEIRSFKQQIKVTNDEITNEEVLVFVSLGYDDATKSQNLFSPTELEYFRLLIEQIMTTITRQITGINALNLVANMNTSFTKSEAQKLLNLWCRMRYLDKEEDNYALGVRAIHEFEGYLRENMPDTIEECFLCKQIVYRGVNCPGCSLAIHNRCLNKYLEKVKKWPCCKIDFRQEQLDQLNRDDSSRIMQRQTQGDRAETVEATQHSQQNSSMESQQDAEAYQVIPEISQRVTRNKKRAKQKLTQDKQMESTQQDEGNTSTESIQQDASQDAPEISQRVTRKRKRC